ncbi:aspartyl protease [Coprinopsis cinerea AmutBmut pab1-1]|nr:aspartyl protease [Coprinopsis cinerea AmutBmut pab1-1]
MVPSARCITPVLATLLLLSGISLCDAAASAMRNRGPAGQTMTLAKRIPAIRTVDEWGEWAKSERLALEAKYGDQPKTRKRSTGTNYIVNQNGDSSYFGSLAIGTPPVSYNVILDTGSADLWVAGSNCTTGCTDVATFNPSSSSTFQNESSAFTITYGSGQAAGFLGQDIVQMAGFQVSNQVFAVCEQVSDGLLQSPVSGLLGLAFETIASSRAMPFWESLVTEGAWDEPLMAFHLTRYLNVTNVQALEPGGSFSMGFANTSLYTGDIDYVDLPTEGTYWILPITGITIQNNSITPPTGQQSYAAIDTGTTLIGGPESYISQIFDQIPGSAPGTGSFENYYTYPCDTDVTVEMSFGGSQSWTINPADFRLTRLTRDSCLGAFFTVTTRGAAPSWIVGDTFLKNVYSVFRYSPPSVGFAQLSSQALAVNGNTDIPVPTPTVGSSPASVSATGLVPGLSSAASARTGHGCDAVLLALLPLVLSCCSYFTLL